MGKGEISRGIRANISLKYLYFYPTKRYQKRWNSTFARRLACMEWFRNLGVVIPPKSTILKNLSFPRPLFVVDGHRVEY
jgi:hypothetical protein